LVLFARNAGASPTCEAELARERAAMVEFRRLAARVFGEGVGAHLPEKLVSEWRARGHRAFERWRSQMDPEVRCLSDGDRGGLWLLMVEQPFLEEGTPSAYWYVEHVDVRGVRRRAPLNGLILQPWLERAQRRPRLFFTQAENLLPRIEAEDIDGDGVRELFVWTTFDQGRANRTADDLATWGVESLWPDKQRRGQILAFTSDSVTLLEQTKHLVFSDARDVDGDGRRDVLTHGAFWRMVTYAPQTGPFSGRMPIRGPEFVGFRRGHKFVFGEEPWTEQSVERECSSLTTACAGPSIGSEFLAIACAKARKKDVRSLVRQCRWGESLGRSFEPKGLWREWLQRLPPTSMK